MSFLFKEVTEKEKEEIKREADRIIEDFSKKLESLGEIKFEGDVKRVKSFRRETLKFDCDPKLKKRILNNAKNKNEDFIIAEKKKW